MALFAEATARTALGLPIRRASSLYDMMGIEEEKEESQEVINEEHNIVEEETVEVIKVEKTENDEN